MSRNPNFESNDLPEYENRIQMLTSKNFPSTLTKLATLSIGSISINISEVRITDNDFKERIQDSVKSLPKEKIENYLRSDKGYSFNDGILYYEGLIVVLENNLRKEIMDMRHSTPETGHFGVDKTVELVMRDFVWKGLRSDVEKFV